MLDLAQLRAAATGDPSEEMPVTRSFLAQALEEITAGRAAHERLGQVFGRPQGTAL